MHSNMDRIRCQIIKMSASVIRKSDALTYGTVKRSGAKYSRNHRAKENHEQYKRDNKDEAIKKSKDHKKNISKMRLARIREL